MTYEEYKEQVCLFLRHRPACSGPRIEKYSREGFEQGTAACDVADFLDITFEQDAE